MLSVRASSTEGKALRRYGSTVCSALDDAAMKSNGRCAAATSGPLADTAASARSDAHLSSSCLQRHAVMQD